MFCDKFHMFVASNVWRVGDDIQSNIKIRFWDCYWVIAWFIREAFKRYDGETPEKYFQ